MIRWLLTLVVNRLILMAVFLFALNAFSQDSSAMNGGNTQTLLQALSNLPDALKTLSGSFR
ncbi:hypothetical protein [Pleomorphomonas sp. JP5]|uniref:hypothetical protein n=1 Tax=Pleomorphomonas sp. JP5 TaxID=2942998 RepID=UPI0020443CF5|nr:hypothetical protein [Pleomorphomonas sp. JP5]MCM5559369.1 hypothetical protein [Pleomorphomonas sp. JP5]